MTFKSNGQALDGLAGGIGFGGGVVWRVVSKPPGAEEEGDLCGPVPEGSPRCGRSGAAIRDIRLRPGQSKTFEFVAEAVEYRCPGYGDFWTPVFAGHFGSLIKGPQSFEIFLLFENEPAEYESQKRALGQTPPPRDDTPCDPHTVGLSG